MSETLDLPAGARERIAAVPMPARIARLIRDARGYPVPRFVLWRDGQPDFRIMDTDHLMACFTRDICWVCGDPMGRYKTFVVGPMCIINRTSAEPPSHLECGRYSAQVCPFLAIPAMRRIEAGMPDGVTQPGIGIKRNPGVVCLWTTRGYRIWQPPGGGVLFEIGEPTSVEWWSRGRTAQRAEVEASIETGLPLLENVARDEGPAALAELAAMHTKAMGYLPA